MRYVNGFFFVILVVFALLQYNDPDALFWFAIYGIGAAWCGLATFWPNAFSSRSFLAHLFLVCLIAALVGTIYFWPTGEAWWDGQVIWDSEVVREGLGMLIMTVAMLLAGSTLWWSGRLAVAGR